MKIKQVVVTGQNQVALQDDLLEDRPLADDEVLIATEATFISAGTELANYTGREPKVFQPGQWCTYPWKSGYANVGVVQAVGRAVTRVKPGERVFSYGNHASAVRYNQRRLVIPVPPELDPVVAAAPGAPWGSATIRSCCSWGGSSRSKGSRSRSEPSPNSADRTPCC